MNKNYTYSDVLRKASSLGLLQNMSDADRALSRQNPDAGMTVLLSRNDYRSAANDEQRALAHARAEQARKQYGGYSGGTDGSGYYVNPISPADYEAAAAPSFGDRYGSAIDGRADAVLRRESYVSPYGDRTAALLDAIEAAPSFTYDPGSDDLFAAYAKQYRREGQRAVADTMGQAASLTGGIPSSAAVTAASQAGDYYAAKLSDKIPELAALAYDRAADRQNQLLAALKARQTADQTAYDRYLDSVDLDLDAVEMLRALRSDDYLRYRDDLAQYNTDRDFGYNRFTDDISYDNALESAARSQANYEEERALEQRRYDDELRLNQERYDTETAANREKYERELAAAEEERLWNAALYAYEYLGDSSLLRQLIAKERSR